MAFEVPPRSGRVAQRPALFTEMHARFPQQDSGLAVALKACADGYRATHDAHERLARDESSTVGARIVKSARHARTKLEPAIAALDKALSTAKEGAKQMREKVQAAYRNPNPNFVEFSLGQEIRAQFLKMNHAEIAKALEVAKETGDLETIQAVASYDRKLANIPPDLHRWARDVLIAERAPEEASILARYGEQIGLASQFRDEMLSSLGELIDFRRAAEIETAAQADLV